MKLRRILSLATALLLTFSLPLAAFADTWYLEDGDITISANESGQTVSQGTTNKSDNKPTIKQKDSGTSTGNTITINTEGNATANVTIEGVTIKADKPGIEVGGSNLNLTVKGENKIENTSGEENSSAGIHVSSGDLTITGDGTLDVNTSGWYSAGIGSDENETMSGSITIKDGAKVTATTDSDGAGIGTGSGGDMTGSITIKDGAKVTATTDSKGAGIGTGKGGKMAGRITIADNAQVSGTAKYGAGIGSGREGKMSGTITIDDTAKVTAKSGPEVGSSGGAGIGSGVRGKMSGTISISNKATVNASGHRFGNPPSEDIGAGSAGENTGTVEYFEPQPKPTHPAPTQPAPAKTSLYRVLNERGEPLSCTKELADGVLTITVDADYAKLIGTVLSLKTLEKQGVTTIVLVTRAATSTFALADLQAKGTGTYTLTHDGATVTFTLAKADVSDILK